MQMRNPTFEVRPSVITGDTADVYLHRTQRILRNEGLNPTVSMQFSASREAVLSGSLEVKALIGKVTSEGNRELWAVEEGSPISQDEVCLEIKAPYSSFGLYETAICGILAHQTVSLGAHNVHPSVAAVMDYAAVVGGCVSGSTVLGAQLAGTAPVATVSGALVQLMGTAVQAMLAFDKAVAPDVQRIAYVDPRKDIVEQVEQVARASGTNLDSVRLARTGGGRPVAAEDVQRVREKLDSMSARKVGIVVSGRLTPERVSQLLDQGAPVDVFHDVSYIASAAPVAFLPNIRTISDREVPQETEPPPPNPRLRRLL